MSEVFRLENNSNFLIFIITLWLSLGTSLLSGNTEIFRGTCHCFFNFQVVKKVVCASYNRRTKSIHSRVVTSGFFVREKSWYSSCSLPVSLRLCPKIKFKIRKPLGHGAVASVTSEARAFSGHTFWGCY